jgi:hypothetical protein
LLSALTLALAKTQNDQRKLRIERRDGSRCGVNQVTYTHVRFDYMDGKRLVLAALVAVAASTVSLALGQKPVPPQKSVWFVLLEEFGSNGKLVLNRLATSSEGKLSKVPDDCSPDDPAAKQFSAEYFNAGHSYSVLFGGIAAGGAVVRAPDKDPVR